MAQHAAAQETLLALRREIARIEGEPPGRLAGGGTCSATAADSGERQALPVLLRTHGRANVPLLATGAADFDAALGGGLCGDALTEIIAADTRDAAAAASFALGLAGRMPGLRPAGRGMLLHVSDHESMREGGGLFVPGLALHAGLDPARLLVAHAARPADVLWIAEEAASSGAVAMVLAELRGNPRALTLVATQRLNRRAGARGCAILLVRQHATPEPTAAPVRLAVRSAPAGRRTVFGVPLPGSIGMPAAEVTISKARNAGSGTFILEWNAHDRSFETRPHPVAALSAPSDRPAAPAGTGTVVAGRFGGRHDGHRAATG